MDSTVEAEQAEAPQGVDSRKLAGLLTLLRWLTAGAMVAVLTALAQAGLRPALGADSPAGWLIVSYLLASSAIFLFVYFAPGRAYWLVSISMLLDLAAMIGISIATGGALALFALLPVFAISVMRSIWPGLMAAAIFAAHLPFVWPPAAELGQLPAPTGALLFGLLLLVALLWVSLLAGNNGQLVRGYAEAALRSERKASARYKLAMSRAKSIYNVTYALSGALSYESVLRSIFEEITRVVPMNAGMVLLVEPGTNALFVSGSFGMTKAEVDRKIDMRTGKLGRAVASGTSAIVDDLKSEEELVASWPRLEGFSSAIVVPLRSRFELYEVILAAVQKGQYDQEELELMTALGNNAIIALQNAGLYQNLREERDRLLAKEDNVRRQLARDLHDGPAQTLAAITMNVEFIKKLLYHAPNRVGTELDQLSEMARRANADVRTLLFELRPAILESHGLVAGLASYVQRFPDTDLPRVHYQAEDIEVRLPPAAETTVFNVVQEAINNAKKHARARNIWVSLRRLGNRLVVVIRDDGLGFEVAAQQEAATRRGSYGLMNMRERAQAVDGEMVIDSARGHGTTITLTVPVAA